MLLLVWLHGFSGEGSFGGTAMASAGLHACNVACGLCIVVIVLVTRQREVSLRPSGADGLVGRGIGRGGFGESDCP